jgi:ABC-2 type transport system ATP-binding protein
VHGGGDRGELRPSRLERELEDRPVSSDAHVLVDDVSKHFRSTIAVDHLTFEAGRGVIGLLGPNGAGKTTLLRMLATVLDPDAGRVRLFGLDPQRRGERLEIRRRLGYLPQQAGLYSGFSGFDLVDYVAVLKEWNDRSRRHDEVRRVLELVDMTDDMHRRIRSMSGGMQRRIAIAASLIGSPDLLVLDEPSAGLDPEQRLRLRGVLSGAGRQGCVIVSTHLTDEVAAFCNRVIVLGHGTVRFDDEPGRLASVAAGRVWIDDAPSLDAVHSWYTADGSVRNVGTPPGGAELVEPTLDDGYLLLTHDTKVTS